MSVTNQQVVSLLENVLFETATQATVNAATWQANTAATSVSSLASAMANSGEAKIAATVVGYYLTSLGRAPTAAEVQYYVGVAEQGLTQSQIAAGQVSGGTWNTIASYFSHSAEFTARAGLDNSLGVTGGLLEAVPFLYEQVLGRAPTSAEISYYDNQVVSGTDLGVLFREFTASPEFHTDTDAQIAAALASFGTSTVAGSPPPVVALSVTLGAPPPTSTPSPAPTPTPTFHALTTANDTINDSGISGAHTYDAILGAGATLNAGDSLTGNGLATLAITDVASNATNGLPGTLHGIQAITLTTAGNAGQNIGNPFNASAVTDLTSLTVTSANSQGDFIAATQSVAVTIDTPSATVSVKDFASLDITDNNLTTLDLTRTSGFNGNVTIHDPTGPLSLTINVDNLSSFTGAITDASNHVTTVTIAGSTNLSNIDAFADSALTSLTLTGNVTLGTPVSHFSGNSGLSTLDLSGDTNTGGPNFININSAATVTLGNTNNTLIDNGATAGGGGSITAGDGNNTITDNSANGATSITVGNGTNTITANSTGAGGAFSFGTGNNELDLQGSHGGATVTVLASATFDSDTSSPNLVIDNAPSGLTIVFGAQTGLTLGNDYHLGGQTNSQLFTNLTFSLPNGAQEVNWGDDGTNTYISETDNATINAGHVTFIEITGIHTVTVNNGNIVIGP